MLTVYGIKSCDTVKKALKWLDEEGVVHTYHDMRVDGLDVADIERWVVALGWESVVNRRSTTWRELPQADKQGLDAAKAVKLMFQHPTLIKRPVFEGNGLILNGFTDAVRARIK